MDHISMWSDLSLLHKADKVAEYSKDPSTQVGAILFADFDWFIQGWNHIPYRISHNDDKLFDRGWKIPRIIHAEMDCLMHITPNVQKELTMAVTHFPCERCAAHMIEAGVTKVITRKPSDDFLSRWPGMVTAAEMFEEARIKLIYPEI